MILQSHLQERQLNFKRMLIVIGNFGQGQTAAGEEVMLKVAQEGKINSTCPSGVS